LWGRQQKKIANAAIKCRGCNNMKNVIQQKILGDAAVKNR